MTGSRGHQHTTPLFIDHLEPSGTARSLDRLAFARRDGGSHAHDEGWLQQLIYRFPQLLPVSEIEPGFGSLVPVCLELPTPVGSVDNLFVTETGNLAIAECKLWRNPEARREVVAQIIDYAHSMARWSYEDFESATRLGMRLHGDATFGSLFSLFGDAIDLDEPSFIDAVSRNLRLGRILLLIVGDGIREGVETLTDFLQMHAGFHFTLGVVEMAVFRMPSDGFLVQPRVLARTVNIERGIVHLADSQVTIEPPERTTKTTSSRRIAMSEEQFFEKLAETAPEVRPALERFLEQAEEMGIFKEPAEKSLQIRWRGPDEMVFALGGIDPYGRFLTNNVNWRPDSMGRLDLAHQYLEKLASLIGASVRQVQNPAGWYVVKNGTTLPSVTEVLYRSDEWLQIIRWYTRELAAALDRR